MDGEQLHISGLTGIDLSLPVAGPGSRSYAFIIDWHIRILLAAAWAGAGWLLLAGLMPLGAGALNKGVLSMLLLWPALLIYFLYHPLLEILMHGRTPGKRMAGVRLVTRSGGYPGAGAILTRNIFRLIDALPFLYLVGLSCCVFSAQRLRIGDMAAGTVLVLDGSGSTEALAQLPALVSSTGIDPGQLELLRELLRRWSSLEIVHRDAIARSLLAHLQSDPSAVAPAELTDEALLRRLRAVLTVPGA